ncbi:MAG: response regulator [Omnitrophica bacterium]|nr:response regulator [Candidatus Omnitrophota bacterium]
MDRFKILIADDDETVRNLFERFLAMKGYQVSIAIDGFDALDKLNNYHYDMLILDLKMPGMTLLDKLNRQKNEQIIITGYAIVETAKVAIKNGCFGYITKPFDIENVSIVIKRALQMHWLFEEKKKLKEHILVAQK